jgi:hypothetical protein
MIGIQAMRLLALHLAAVLQSRAFYQTARCQAVAAYLFRTCYGFRVERT